MTPAQRALIQLPLKQEQEVRDQNLEVVLGVKDRKAATWRGGCDWQWGNSVNNVFVCNSFFCHTVHTLDKASLYDDTLTHLSRLVQYRHPADWRSRATHERRCAAHLLIPAEIP